ncbi:hypothetical protein D3C80_669080 [compost metagenome]
MIAAILYLHECACAAFNGIDHMTRGFAHFHNVVDADLLKLVHAEVGQHTVGVGLELFLVAQNEVDFIHGLEFGRFRLRGTAGDDNARFRIVAACLADCLTRLTHGFRCYGTGVEDDRAVF